MRPLFRLALFFSVFLLLLIGLWFRSEHRDMFPNEQTVIEQRALNEHQSEDLVMTIELFMEQVKQDLLAWEGIEGDSAWLEEEINEHPHIDGFAAYDSETKKNQFQFGTLPENPFHVLERYVLEEDRWSFSEPYISNGTKKILFAIQKEDSVLFSEVDVSFMEHFIKNMASVADNQGNMFIGDGEFDTSFNGLEAELDDTAILKEIPELNWRLYLQSERAPTREEVKRGEVIVVLNNNIDPQVWADDHQVFLLGQMGNTVVVRDLTRDAQQIIDDWTGDPTIDFMEPNYTYEKQAFERNQDLLIPNDEFYEGYQWNLKQLDLEQAWNISQGRDMVPVAIIDSGVDPDHIDLAGRIENGYNAFENNGAFHDDHGHGTHVAGIFGAVTNNRDGIAGVSWESPILAVKALDDEAIGNSFSIARGIRWATDQGAKVINLSLGDNHDSEVMHEAIQYAYDRDVVLIAASGNDNVETPMYPAAYEEVLTVGSIDHHLRRSIFSNFGNHLDVTAPGEHIPSTYLGGEYVMMSGTSMASPHVAGVVSLLRSYDPNMSNEEVYDHIRKTAYDLGLRGHDPYYGFGAINSSEIFNIEHNE